MTTKVSQLPWHGPSPVLQQDDRAGPGPAAAPNDAPRVCQIEVSVYRIPTDRPEADGTLAWDSTTLVLVEAVSDSGARGLGYTYAASAAAAVIREILACNVVGRSADDLGGTWEAM